MSSDCHRAWHLLAEASQQTSAVESDVSPERGDELFDQEDMSADQNHHE